MRAALDWIIVGLCLGDDPATIAAMLTEAQRKAVLGFTSRGSSRAQLVKLGVMELKPRKQTWAAKVERFDYHLTPLGLSVRQHLIACENGGNLPEKAGQEGATNTNPALTNTNTERSHG